MNKAARKTIRDLLILIAIGVIYYLIIRFTGFGIPCTFRVLTGYKCPSCGISHMFLDLARFDFKAAFADNQFLFITWPFLAIFGIHSIYEIEANRDLSKTDLVFICIYAATLLVFGIFRIIYSF